MARCLGEMKKRHPLGATWEGSLPTCLKEAAPESVIAASSPSLEELAVDPQKLKGLLAAN